MLDAVDRLKKEVMDPKAGNIKNIQSMPYDQNSLYLGTT
jgi:hypothetical protein